MTKSQTCEDYSPDKDQAVCVGGENGSASVFAPYRNMNCQSRLNAEFGRADEYYKQKEILPSDFEIVGEGQCRSADLIAKSDGNRLPNRDDPSHRVFGYEISSKAKELGETQPTRWLNDEAHNVYRCNQFLDASLRGADVALPWSAKNVPTVHQMRPQLQRDKNFIVVSSYKNAHAVYDRLQPGDVVMWDYVAPHYRNERPHRMEHCGILDENRNLLYSGSTRSHGYDVTPFDQLCKLYGAPTVIYRYNGQHR